MFGEVNRKEVGERRHLRVREKVFETPERPRLSVYRSEKNIYVQIIDGVNAVTLIAASNLNRVIGVKGSNKEAAKLAGELVTERVIERGVSDVVSDRGGYIYYGRVKVLASEAEEVESKL